MTKVEVKAERERNKGVCEEDRRGGKCCGRRDAGENVIERGKDEWDVRPNKWRGLMGMRMLDRAREVSEKHRVR